MVKRILFISPRRTFVQSQIHNDYYYHRVNVCLPALLILGELERAGWECSFVDMAADGYKNVRNINEYIATFGLENSNVLKTIEEIRPDLVFITSMFTSEFMEIDDTSAAIKQRFPSLPIVLGGVHPTAIIHSVRTPKEKAEWLFERSYADVAVVGEVEENIAELAEKSADQTTSLEHLPNLLIQQNGTVIQTKRVIKKVTNLNRPWAFQSVLFDPQGNYRYTVETNKRSALDVNGDEYSPVARAFAFYHSRGCPMGCHYCATTPRDGATVRHAGAEKMFTDFRYAHEQLDVSYFYNQADTFGLHTEDRRFLKMVSDYRSQHQAAPFVLHNPNAFFVKIFFLQDSGFEIDHRFIDLLAKSGFRVVTLAIETFVQRFNKKIHFQEITPQKVFQLCDALHKAGLKIEIYMLYGFPPPPGGSVGQATEEFQQDVTQFQELKKHVDQIDYHNVMLFPGTTYYDYMLRTEKFTEREYRQALVNGYSFNRLPDAFNFSNVSTEEYVCTVTALQKDIA